jgi:hypothetical protein
MVWNGSSSTSCTFVGPDLPRRIDPKAAGQNALAQVLLDGASIDGAKVSRSFGHAEPQRQLKPDPGLAATRF